MRERYVMLRHFSCEKCDEGVLIFGICPTGSLARLFIPSRICRYFPSSCYLSRFLSRPVRLRTGLAVHAAYPVRSWLQNKYKRLKNWPRCLPYVCYLETKHICRNNFAAVSLTSAVPYLFLLSSVVVRLRLLAPSSVHSFMVFVEYLHNFANKTF